MKKKIKVQINTNYFCNYNCEYCYLGNLRKNPKVIDTQKLKENLDEIAAEYDIDTIGIYGGEVTLLPKQQVRKIVEISKEYARHVFLVTNFSNPDYIKEFSDIGLSTSLNKERDNYELTKYRLLINDNYNLGLNIVVTPSVLASNIESLINELDQYGLDTEFLRYSPSEIGDVNYDISNKDYADFIRKVIVEYKKRPRNFWLCNITSIEECLNGTHSPCMDSFVFISPYNNLQSIKFCDGKEHFIEFEDIDDYRQQCVDEFEAYKKHCGGCKYFGHCYAEHLKLSKKNDECCGLKSLLEWYENLYKNN